MLRLLSAILPTMKIDRIREVIAIRTLFLANDPSEKWWQKWASRNSLGDDYYCPYKIRVPTPKECSTQLA
jgi:hypothetical protein